MATVTLTWTAGSYAGAGIRGLASALEKVAMSVPDINSTGASTVLTIDNAPATGKVSVQVTAGPYSGNAEIIG